MSHAHSIGEVLHAALLQAAAEVSSTQAAALADEPDAVHQHRVRVRRLRSVMAGFRSVLDTRAEERVRVAYAEWGRELGVVRDIEVRADVAEEMLARAEVHDPDIVRRLVTTEREAYAGAHARLLELSREPRALARASMLHAFVDNPGLADPAARADDIIAAVLGAQVKRVRAAAKRVDGTDDSYHALRKAARRMRYVGEAVAVAAPGLFEAEVTELAETGDELHGVLGGHRDAVLFAERVVREGILAARAGEPSGAYGIVEEIAREDAAEHLSKVPEALKKLKAAASRLR